MNANDIIIKPVISEKSSVFIENKKYVFKVAMQANKLMVEKAINELFSVTPKKINMMVVRGKKRRIRYQMGKRSAWKKAIVTLRAGESIKIFDAQ